MNGSNSGKINDFFESYAQALTAYDAKLMAQHYQVPCSFISDESTTVFSEASKLEGLFIQGTGFYKQFGIVHCRPEVWSKRFWTEKIAKVKVNWQYFDGENNPVYNCDYHYILRSGKNGAWKIEVSVTVNEKERMEEWLAKRKK
ncbi:MAG: hypothetical protein EOP49_09555 [Sphingobacteriales bacterium]|nr:MAG: hypothetical protein EOP49_09555 [Sphingobacteriales bacterium]